jgi:hypothetical protein
MIIYTTRAGGGTGDGAARTRPARPDRREDWRTRTGTTSVVRMCARRNKRSIRSIKQNGTAGRRFRLRLRPIGVYAICTPHPTSCPARELLSPRHLIQATSTRVHVLQSGMGAGEIQRSILLAQPRTTCSRFAPSASRSFSPRCRSLCCIP